MSLKVRYPRIERTEPPLLEEDLNSHLWAVSYSDFLMTLLCFFILLFSADENLQDSLILSISKAFTQNAELKNESSVNKTYYSSQALEKELKLVFEQISVHKDKKNLIIEMPDNLFNSNEYILSSSQEKLLKNVFTKIFSYESKVKLYFEGHTDDRPLHRKVSNLVLDNYVLGSLRAASALQVAKQIGFMERDLYTQTSTSFKRNSRTLSIRIEPKEGDSL